MASHSVAEVAPSFASACRSTSRRGQDLDHGRADRWQGLEHELTLSHRLCPPKCERTRATAELGSGLSGRPLPGSRHQQCLTVHLRLEVPVPREPKGKEFTVLRGAIDKVAFKAFQASSGLRRATREARTALAARLQH